MPQLLPICGNCRHFREKESGDPNRKMFECRRYPPTVVIHCVSVAKDNMTTAENQFGHSSWFPLVHPTQGCGEFVEASQILMPVLAQ